MGQCCSLTYTQYAAGLSWTPDFSRLTLNGYTITAAKAQMLTVYEANEPAPSTGTGDVGGYTQFSCGFVVQLTLTPTSPGQGSTQTIVVVALRGTQTWAEWITDSYGLPAPFAATLFSASGLGSVHSGFYDLYTVGQDGAVATPPLDPSNRADGSIASQIAQYVSTLNNSLPLYVTGHSLGGALATLCALDIAYNFPASFSQIFMYSLASPRVAAGLSADGIDIPTLGNQVGLLSSYQHYVPNSYRIVNAADIIPALGPPSFALGPLTVIFNHVTDPFQLSGTATATASINGGSVTSVTVTSNNDFGLGSWPPTVEFSGGGGTGAAATVSYGLLHGLEVTVTRGGS
jgi:pimeloyl-ACP methyl ester carboxylesterase